MPLLTARWVLPIAAPIIEDGAVLVRGERVVAVGRRADLVKDAAGERWDLGDAAILPGLVNCHTHLELTGVGAVQAPDFVAWLTAVRTSRQALPPEAQAAAVAAAGRALLAAGVTCVGEVSTTEQSPPVLRRLRLRGVVFHEVLGVDPALAPTRLAEARAAVAATAARGGRLGAGLSPHSPYALSEELLRGVGALARETGLPLCTHVAESVEETEYLTRGTGPIPARLYPAVGVTPPPRGRARSPVAYLDGQGALPEGSLLVHAVHIDAEDIRRMRRAGWRVAHCPRSNARLSGGAAPLEALLAAGVPVGLGTDSLASAPSLSLWDEMRAVLADRPALDPAAVLSLATRGGAAALGLEGLGTLKPGQWADVIGVATPARRASEVAASLLDQDVGPALRLVLIAGQPVRQSAEVTPCG